MLRSILVVEDYADLRAALGALLVRDKCTCDYAGSSADALKMIHASDYDAVLFAPRLPIADDPLVQYVIAHPDGAPRLILMTDPLLDDETVAEPCRTLVKPFNHEELLAQLR